MARQTVVATVTEATVTTATVGEKVTASATVGEVTTVTPNTVSQQGGGP